MLSNQTIEKYDQSTSDTRVFTIHIKTKNSERSLLVLFIHDKL